MNLVWKHKVPLKDSSAIVPTFLLLVAVLLLPACGTSREAQLERVAKDWCETIRASQVIAVYPLTQDLQPGDVFLVQTPIDKQQDIYRQDGFLPLDNHLARLEPDGYGDFYDHSFLDPDRPGRLPKDWLAANWTSAPRVAFPTYGFQVSQGQGINLAVPVSGVPVGLSLLGTQSASGTISLKDARTLGVDTESLYLQVRTWAAEDQDRRAFLANFGVWPGETPRNYLRVVTRVYLLGAIDVQLNDARSVSSGLDVGVPRPVELFLPSLPEGVEDVRGVGRENYLRSIERLNAMSGPPLGDVGADPGLSAAEFRARQEGREAARQAEITRLTQARGTAEQALQQAQQAAQASPEATAVTAAGNALTNARHNRDQKLVALETARAANPPVVADIQAAAAAYATSEQQVLAAEQNLAAALQAYDAAHAENIQKAQGQVDIPVSALARLQEVAPGGSFRFTAASARSVSMTETFDKPLVVGYLGFDVPIGVNGELGRPIPTFSIVAGRPMTEPIERVGAFTGGEASYKFQYETVLKLIPRRDQDGVFARAAALMGDASQVTYNDQIGSGNTARQAWSAVFREQLPRGLRSQAERERRYRVMAGALNGAIREYLDNH